MTGPWDPAERSDLDGEWTLYPRGGPLPNGLPDSIPARVPGTAHTDLLAAGLIPDPYADENEALVGWVGESDFAWTTRLRRPPGRHERIELVAEGIDTVAEVRLDGELVATPRNHHRTHRIDVTDRLGDVEGESELEIAIASGLRAAREAEERLGELPHVGNPLPYNAIRKPAYQYGWDWGPTLVTSGIWRPIALHAWSLARLDRVVPRVRVEPDGHGRVSVAVAITATGTARRTSVRMRIAGRSIETVVPAGADAVELETVIRHPSLWWPRGYGCPSLYDLEVELIADGAVVDSWRREVGFRTTELRMDRDEHGVSFELHVNGTRIWVKGANWIPDDLFLPRVTPERYERGVRDAVEGGFNLLRVWGGGIYEDDALYAACDRAGVLVWQDFAFACAAYSESEELWTEVEAEAREQIARLAPHPSLVVWNGSNENVEGYFDWGWRDQLGPDVPWGRGYYDELLPALLEELDGTHPYIPSSPYSPGEYSRPRDPDDGSVHSWEVWNRQDYTVYADSVPRFVAEYGFQAPAQWTTLADAIGDLAPDSPGMRSHQKAQDGDGKLARGLAPHVPAVDVGAPDGIAAWHYATQLNQARAVEFGVAHWRSHWPRTTGSIVWQLNDCWPVTSWAIVDAAGRRKPVWHALRRANAARWAGLQARDGAVALVLHDDADAAWEARITVARVRLDGTVLASADLTATVDARAAVTLALPLEVTTPADPRDELIVAEVGGAARALHWFVEDPELALPPLDLAVRTTASATGCTLELTAGALVKDLVIAADRVSPDAVVDQQLITLLPGETVRLDVNSAVALDPAALVAVPVLQSVNTLAHPDEVRIRIDPQEAPA